MDTDSPELGVCRLAPSPTGALHLGNARSFLIAWLAARQQKRQLLLRIEDIDSPRVKPWAIGATIDDLRWLGLDWDEGPDVQPKSGRVYVQTQRLDRYHEILRELFERNWIYPCICSRSDVAESASAPHEQSLRPLEGLVYPGTCRGKNIDTSQLDGKFAWRWAFGEDTVSWNDGVMGPQTASPLQQLGDFVIARGNSTPAYQLAVVVDDFDMGVTEVVRGNDLVFSTYRQLAIIRALGWREPNYFHVPLIIGVDGRRLAKRHGDTRLSSFRDAGVAPEAIVGYLAFTLGLTEKASPTAARDLIGHFDWSCIGTQPTVFDLEPGLKQLLAMS